MNRTLVWQLALRYLRGKRTGNAVPILSRISIAAMAIGSAALIILFSVINGLIFLVKDLYKAFYPDIKVSIVKGKFFSPGKPLLRKISELPGVLKISGVIEDNVLANSEDEQIVALLKGVDSNYFNVNNVKPYIIEGRDSVDDVSIPWSIIGADLANQMGADVTNIFSRITLYYPNTKKSGGITYPGSAFQTLQLKADGIFRVQYDFDRKYILAPLALVQQLFLEEGKVSSLEIKLAGNTDPETVKRQISQIAGDAYKLETRYEQNKTLYQVMRTEKWVAYAILLLILLIASFNMIGALSLLVLEKQKDIAILRAIGAQPSDIRKLFIIEGLLWSATGGGIGLLLGAALCAGQQKFGWIKLDGAFIISAYPVRMMWTDFAVVITTVLFIGVMASYYPSRRATRAEDPSLKST